LEIEAHSGGAEGVLHLGQELLDGEAQQQPARLLLPRQRRHLRGADAQLVHPEGDEPLQLPAQHFVQGLARRRQVAALAEGDPQPGVGEHQRGLLDAPGHPLHQACHQLPEGSRIARRSAQQTVLERIARQGRLAEVAQAEAVAVVQELAIAQPLAVEGEDVRRHGDGVEAQQPAPPCASGTPAAARANRRR